jgi:hypothetical protein
MGETQGVIRMNVSVRRELKARMDAVASSVNWSAVASQAFEAKLLQLASQKETGKMRDVIERLKAAAELEANKDYQEGFQAGQTWAKKDATPKQLRRLAKYIEDWPALDWWEGDGVVNALALTILNLSRDESDQGTLDAFWEGALGDLAPRISDLDFLRGFSEGAMDVWGQVWDKL